MKDFTHRRYTKLTTENVLLIKDLLKQNANQTKLAVEFRVSRATINRIANNKAWEDIK